MRTPKEFRDLIIYRVYDLLGVVTPEVGRLINDITDVYAKETGQMTNEQQETAQYAKPVLKQTEVQQECQTCFVPVPQSNIDKHLAWHRERGDALKATDVGGVMDSAIRNDAAAARRQQQGWEGQ